MNTVTKVLSATAFAGLIGVGAVGGGHAHASELTNQASHTVAQAQSNQAQGNQAQGNQAQGNQVQGNQNLEKQPNGVIGNAPDLTVKDQTLKYGQKWNPYQGVTAKDKEDGDLTNNVQYDQGYFDGHTPGDYKIKYHVEDSTGNSADASSNLHVMTQGQTDQWNAQHPNGEQPDTGGVHHGQVSGPENGTQPQPKPEPQPKPQPGQDDNQKPGQDDNQKPGQDDNQKPGQDDNQKPGQDDNQKPGQDDNQKPGQDDNQKPGQDDNQKPGQDDNTNNELPHADHSHDHDGYHDMTPHGDQGQNTTTNGNQGTNTANNQGTNTGQNTTTDNNDHVTGNTVEPTHVSTTPQHTQATQVTTNNDTATTNDKVDNKAIDHKAKEDKDTLPETGQEDSNVGLWASILGALGLGGLVTASRRRKENE